MTDPAAVHVFSHLSASIVLSRKRASEGLYPAIELLQSSSKMSTAAVVGARHYALAQEVRKTLARYEDLKDIIAMLGMEQLSPEDRMAAGRARRLERFLTQPFFTTEQFSGIAGKTVSLKDSLDGCERILRDEFKDYPESALYMIGAIGEAKKPTPQAKAAGPRLAPAAADPAKQAGGAKRSGAPESVKTVRGEKAPPMAHPDPEHSAKVEPTKIRSTEAEPPTTEPAKTEGAAAAAKPTKPAEAQPPNDNPARGEGARPPSIQGV
jgi:F-type H+-transporting ATPase subunit beta